MNYRFARLAEAYVEHSRDWERREMLRSIREETIEAVRVLDERIDQHRRKIERLEASLSNPEIRNPA